MVLPWLELDSCQPSGWQLLGLVEFDRRLHLHCDAIRDWGFGSCSVVRLEPSGCHHECSLLHLGYHLQLLLAPAPLEGLGPGGDLREVELQC